MCFEIGLLDAELPVGTWLSLPLWLPMIQQGWIS